MQNQPCYRVHQSTVGMLSPDGRPEPLRAGKPKGTYKRRGTTNLAVLLLIVVLAALAAVLSYRAFLKRFDAELRVAVLKHLTEKFPQARVQVDRVSKDFRGCVVVHNVRMATESFGKPVQVFSAEQIVVKGQLDISDFLKQTLKVEQIELLGVQVDAWPMENGSWSVEALRPATTEKQAPRIVLHDSQIRLRQQATRQANDIVIHGVHATVQAVSVAPVESSGASFDLGTQTGQILHITGSAQSSGLLEELKIDCWLNAQTKQIQAAGNFAGLHFSPRLLDRLPNLISQKLTQLSDLECQVSCNHFRIGWAPDQPAKFFCQGQLRSGRIQDRRLPYPIEQITSDFCCENTLLQLRNTHARSGGATLKFATDIMGLGPECPVDIEAQIENLDLDQRLYQSLPIVAQQQWDNLQLAGRVSGNLKLHFDGQRWQPSAAIQCQQVSIKPWLFPYQFTHIEGQIHYANGQLVGNALTGKASGQSLEASLKLTHTTMPQGTQWLGRLQCRSLGVVPIDEDLLAALTPAGKPTSGAEKFVRTLRLAGGVELINATFERTSLESPIWDRTLEAHVYDGKVQYQAFLFPIYHVRGRILNKGHQWQIDGFEGRHDSARILGSGSWQQTAQGSPPFQLQIVAHSVPIVEDLIHALPANAQHVCQELQPTGSIDRVQLTVQRPQADAAIDIQVLLDEQTKEVEANAKSIRLFPRRFPYLLNDVSCRVIYQNGKVEIQHAAAVNGATRLAISGQCQAVDQNSWRADINWLPNTRWMVDSQLIQALPKSIQESLQKLDFQGPISVLGKSQTLVGKQGEELATNWDLQLDVEDGKFASGAHLGAMRGTVWVRGQADPQKLRAEGQLAMDAMRVLKTPVTNLKGPFLILDSKIYFGTAVNEALPNPTKPLQDLTATALAGALKSSGYGRLDTGKFYIDASLENARLSLLLKDIGIHSQSPDAVCNATLNFRGVPWNPQTYDGNGAIHLSDAKLYELPFMMRFLSVASVSGNDASAFQRADVNFRLDGDHIPLQVSADGDVLRLRGEGWTNLRRDIELQLYTYVGRRAPIGRVIAPLLPESRFSTFMMVEITGTLDSPDMQRRPFPQLEATLQQIFPEVAELHPVRDAVNTWRN